MQPHWIGFFVAVASALALTPVARLLALSFGALDRPDGLRKLQRAPVPLWGGAAVYGALVLGLLAARQVGFLRSSELVQLSDALIAAAGFVCIMGAIDDSWDLNPRFKLLVQCVGALPVVCTGYYVERFVAFGHPVELGWLGAPLTVVWLVGCINALNFLDGMDGLASVVGLSTAAMLALIAHNCGHDHVAVIALVLAGALAGFVAFNLPPAGIYLGDSGSMVIGLTVGILGMQGAMKTTATLSITAPVVVMTVPILDTVMAVLRRRLTGRAFDSADRGHIHHKLLERGLTNWQALCIVGALCLTTGAAATAATILRNDALAWITALCLVLVLVRTRAFAYDELRLLKHALLRAYRRVFDAAAGALGAMASHGRALPQRASFAEAWDALTGEAARWQAAQLELVIDAADGARTHRWRDPSAAHSSAWTVSLKFADPSGTACTLHVAGPGPAPLQPWLLLRLGTIVRRYGSCWAADEAASPTTLPLAVSPEPAASRRHAA